MCHASSKPFKPKYSDSWKRGRLTRVSLHGYRQCFVHFGRTTVIKHSRYAPIGKCARFRNDAATAKGYGLFHAGMQAFHSNVDIRSNLSRSRYGSKVPGKSSRISWTWNSTVECEYFSQKRKRAEHWRGRVSTSFVTHRILVVNISFVHFHCDVKT